jgi:hypothetical protein
MDLYKLIDEAEFKFQGLPDSYFREYFEKEFLPKIKDIYTRLSEKINIEADSLKEAEFLNEIRKIV